VDSGIHLFHRRVALIKFVRQGNIGEFVKDCLRDVRHHCICRTSFDEAGVIAVNDLLVIIIAL
jgi:hypothetical protein